MSARISCSIMNKFQEGLQQQRRLIEQLRCEAQITRFRVSHCVADLQKYCDTHIEEDYLIRGFSKPSENPFKEKGGCAILWTLWCGFYGFITSDLRLSCYVLCMKISPSLNVWLQIYECCWCKGLYHWCGPVALVAPKCLISGMLWPG